MRIFKLPPAILTVAAVDQIVFTVVNVNYESNVMKYYIDCIVS